MTQVIEKIKKDIYAKHQSFDDFISNIKADVEQQRLRCVSLIEKAVEEKTCVYREVLEKALVDLISENKDDVDFRISRYSADELSRMEDKNVPRYIAHRYRYDVYPKKKILDAYPPYLQIEPSSICNYRCVFCFQTDASFTKKESGHMGTMSLELFKNIIDQIQGHIEFMSFASRGEPMICKDIDQMLEYCVGKFLGLKVNTNASLLTERHCHAVLAGGVNTIVFSCDAAEEPLYSQLRVRGKLEKVLSNIRMFNEIRKKHYPQSKIISRVSGVRVNEAQNMESMYKFWGELVDQVCFVSYVPWENVYESPENNIAAPCSEIWRRLYLWWDGKANACEPDFKSTFSDGNIKDKNISELWHSPALQSLRANHLKGARKDIHPCKGCIVT